MMSRGPWFPSGFSSGCNELKADRRACCLATSKSASSSRERSNWALENGELLNLHQPILLRCVRTGPPRSQGVTLANS